MIQLRQAGNSLFPTCPRPMKKGEYAKRTKNEGFFKISERKNL
jgi:hypothetical protein